MEAEFKKADYVIIKIEPESQKSADGGIGYLFDHYHDVAAKLGKQFGADYVLGQQTTQTQLFVCLFNGAFS